MAKSSSSPAVASKPQSLIVKLYLVLYNSLCILGWLIVDYHIVNHFLANGFDHPERLWPLVEMPLKIVQTAAVLEVFHAAFGFVRSPVFVTFVQVLSRLAVLWGYVNLSKDSQNAWPFVLMVSAWAAIEVPRYLFYVLSTIDKDSVPYILQWLRYSLFVVLYPAGITGEVLSIWNSLPNISKNGKALGLIIEQPNAWNIQYNHVILAYILFAVYVPGSPFMILNMWNSRQRAMNPKPKAETKKD